MSINCACVLMDLYINFFAISYIYYAVAIADNALYDESALAQLEASTYEIPVSNQPEHDYSEASTELTHTYDYTSFDPYEDVVNFCVSFE